jgi:type IV pilus assembly protein PilV
MKNNIRVNSSLRARQQGISLIEVLISIIIIAIALFGTAALQLSAMKLGQGGVLRSHAVFLAQDIAERMEGNVAAAIAGSYVVTTTGTAPVLDLTCQAGACTQAQLATYDISQWANLVSSALPQSTWSITRTVSGNPSTYVIVISWTDRRTKTSDTTIGGIADSYTLTRTVLQ